MTENTDHGELWDIMVRGYLGLSIGPGLWFCSFMEYLRKQSFTLDQALSGSRDNSIIVYLNRMKLKVHLLKKVGEILWFGEFVS